MASKLQLRVLLVGTSFLVLLLSQGLLFQQASAATASEWRSRTIYQALTDRFAVTNGGAPSCPNLGGQYCGGTWRGMADKLDYIQGMGFDAVWISPVISQVEPGFHGYWANDFFSLNPHFGTVDDLKYLAQKLKERDMYLMVDVVGNHPGDIGTDYSKIKPFNQAIYYHDCNGCPSSCKIEDFNNQPQVEHCRLSGLPDLNQSNTFVHDSLIKSIRDVSGQFADGFRVDTVPEVSKDFWTDLTKAVNGKFLTGETYDGRVDYCAGYQGPLPSVLSYPMYFTARGVFSSHSSMKELSSRMMEYEKYFKDTSVLCSFDNNHDQPRFLNLNSDQWLFRNHMVWTLFSEGIPIIYYGDEQGFNGGNDPYNREPLWTSGYNTKADLYQFLKTTIAARKKAEVWDYDQVERWVDDTFYAFTRGNTLIALTNVGNNGATQERTITYHPYSVGTKLCNIYWSGDCVTVTASGITVTLLHGEPKVLLPSN